LARPAKGRDVAALLRQTGWVNTAGSGCPYLAIRARLPDCRRADVDRALRERHVLAEVQTVRGCAMLVPDGDLALALQAGWWSAADRLEQIRDACEITQRELDLLREAIAAALARGPATTDALRARVPGRLVRNLGEAGRRFGESSTLTFALRLLVLEGRARRLGANGRLDDRHYAFELRSVNPLEGEGAPGQTQLARELSRHFFTAAGPATIDEAAWWSGLTRGEVREAIRSLGLRSATVKERATEAWVMPDEAQARVMLADAGDRVVLLPFRDNYLYFRRGLAPFIDRSAARAEVLDWRGRRARLADADSLHHHAIVMGGRLVGIWEYDPEPKRIAWAQLGMLTATQRKAIGHEIAATEGFIKDDLGDLKFYAADNSKNRQLRLRFIRHLEA
jgi:hypothetical protein